MTRVFISKGDGKITVNDKDYKVYFPLVYLQNQVEAPLKAIEATDKFDIVINAAGGGVKGQAEAAKLGIDRALLEVNAEYRPVLKAAGFLTRWAALGLAVFSLASGVLFHYQPADAMQMISFMKNLAIAGGFLVLAAHGAGALSVDGWLAKRAGKAGAP